MPATIPPCSQSRIRAFHCGDDAPAHSIRAAQQICSTCPLLRGCALDAMTAGDLLDGSISRPAAGVIQASVVCHGDRLTLRALAKIAGVPVPEVRTTGAKKPPTPSTCRGCGADMVPWTRGEVPEGKVIHRGRGFGECCRVAYQLDLQEHGRKRQGLHKTIDRLRHHGIRQRWEAAQEALRAAQQDGFDLTTAEAAELAGVSHSTVDHRIRKGLLQSWTIEGVRGRRFRSEEVAREFGVHGPVTPDGLFISPRIPPRIDENIRTLKATEHHEAA